MRKLLTPGRALLAGTAVIVSLVAVSAAESPARLTLRGRAQTLHLYGAASAEPIVLSSGDGGWVHLAPRVAQLLADRGYFVIGFDSKAYLQSFTGAHGSLSEADVASDYRELIAYATRATSKKPIMIGVSEGAGLSALAAASTHALIDGVIGIGLGDTNELGWRWQDSVIYFTHGVPAEPTFSATAIAGRVAPTPLALINSIRDEYVPRSQAEQILAAAQPPKRMWLIDAADHGFTGRLPELAQRLDEAIAWVREQRAH